LFSFDENKIFFKNSLQLSCEQDNLWQLVTSLKENCSIHSTQLVRPLVKMVPSSKNLLSIGFHRLIIMKYKYMFEKNYKNFRSKCRRVWDTPASDYLEALLDLEGHTRVGTCSGASKPFWRTKNLSQILKPAIMASSSVPVCMFLTNFRPIDEELGLLKKICMIVCNAMPQFSRWFPFPSRSLREG
jgi:hypothetical protein